MAHCSSALLANGSLPQPNLLPEGEGTINEHPFATASFREKAWMTTTVRIASGTTIKDEGAGKIMTYQSYLACSDHHTRLCGRRVG